jgi:hypothetical protein
LIIGTFLPDSNITGLCVKVWQIKSSTGHDKEENSLDANNERNLATGTLINSKRVVDKKHHQA